MSKRKKTKERSDKKPEIIGEKPSTTRNHHILSILLILIISIAIYSNTLKNGFVYDDEFTIVNNTLIKNFSNISKLFTKEYFSTSAEMSYRPVVTFTYFIDYWLYGLKSWGYHLTNVLLHAINGVILYIFLTLLFIQPSQSSIFNRQYSIFNFFNPALLISLIFVTHPVLTEAVNAISFREDLLCFLFFILALIPYIAHRSLLIAHCSKFKVFCFQLLSLSFYLLALLSKEMAITFPLIIVLYEWIYGKKSESPQTSPPLQKGRVRVGSLFNPYIIGYIAITIAYLCIRFYLFKNPVEESIYGWLLSERLMTIPYLILKYLLLLIAPVSLSADYVITPINSLISLKFVIPFIIIIFIIILPLIFNLQSSIFNLQFVFGILFFLITLLPVYNIILIANPFAERYLYLPTVGFSIITAALLSWLSGDQKVFKTRGLYILTVSIVLLSVYSFAVIQRNRIWLDSYSLWSDTVIKMPESFRGHNNLGNIYNMQGRLDEAIKEYNISLAFKPDYVDAYNNLGYAYNKQGRLDEAIKEYLTAIKFKPDYAEAHNNIGIVYGKKGQIDEAIKEYKLALTFKPDYAGAHYNLGIAYGRHEKFDEAIKEFKLTLTLKPDYAEAYNNLGFAYYKSGQIEEAMNMYLTSIKYNPNNATAHYNLAMAYNIKGLNNKTIEELEIALKLKPDYLTARQVLESMRRR